MWFRIWHGPFDCTIYDTCSYRLLAFKYLMNFFNQELPIIIKCVTQWSHNRLLLLTEHVIAGLDRAAITMKKGEIALLTIHPEYGFGSIEVQRDTATVPPSSTIIYEIEMLDFTRVILKMLEAAISSHQ